MSLDSVILLSAVVGWTAYFGIHLSVFRVIETKGILSWLMNVYFIGAAVNIGCLVSLLVAKTGLLAIGGLAAVLLCALVSFMLYSLMCYFYVLYVYGIYESSIRIRIMRELYEALPKGLTLEELLNRYNADYILRTRLERLVGSGQVIYDGAVYRIGKCPFVFLMLDYMACAIKKVISS